MLSELRSQINDTIVRVGKESSANGKEMVSMLMSCDFVDVYDLLGEETRAFFFGVYGKLWFHQNGKCKPLM